MLGTICNPSIKICGTELEAAQGAQRLRRMEKRQRRITTNAERDSKTESLRQSESQRGKELDLSEVQGMCLWIPGTERMSRWRFDMRTHLAVTGWETSTLTREDQRQPVKNKLGKLKKTARFVPESPSAAASSDTTVALKYLASCETQ